MLDIPSLPPALVRATKDAEERHGRTLRERGYGQIGGDNIEVDSGNDDGAQGMHELPTFHELLPRIAQLVPLDLIYRPIHVLLQFVERIRGAIDSRVHSAHLRLLREGDAMQGGA